MKSLGTVLTLSCLAVSLISSPVLAKTHHKKKKVYAVHHRKTPSTVHQKHVSAGPAPVVNAGNLAAVLNQAVRGVDGKTVIGVKVKSMKGGETLYSYNESRLFTPASILKVMTAEAALISLGPQYKFTTRVMTDAQNTNNGIINGNVYLVHSGDPSLTYYDLTDLMVALKAQQIQGVAGNVYVDTSAYDQETSAPGWIDSDTRYCYAAPISASIINHNCLSFKVAPSKFTGANASIIGSPRYFYSGFNNEVVTKPSGSRYCSVRLNASDSSTISLSGCLAKGSYARGVSVVLNNVVDYNVALLHSLFRRFNITVGGEVAAKAADGKLSVLAIHQSKPLSRLINEMLKMSDNIIAGSLFKKLGETFTHEPGSWTNGGLAVKSILSQKAGVNTSRMQIIDGSGLSRDNLISPAQVMQVLDYAYHNVDTNYEFISALPIAGVDGTLKRRLSNVAWKVRAKTGTMNGVVSLAGYAMSKDKEPIAFVIIVNGQHGNIWRYREIEDRIVTALTNYRR